MDLSTYKIMHYAGIMLLFLALGGLLVGALNGGRVFPNKRLFSALHGVGLFLVLLSGFGQLARLGIVGSWPGWVVGKVVIWVALGGVIALLLRRPQWNKWLWVLLIGLGTTSSYLGYFKP